MIEQASLVTRPAGGIIERAARILVIAAVVGSAIQAVWAARGLYADGAWFTWTVLTTGDFAIHISRAVEHFVTQVPLVIAMDLGVDDMDALARFQTVGSGAFAILLWASALTVLWRDRQFWPMVVIFSVVFLNSGFMSIGEYNLAYALVALAALAAAILLRSGAVPRGGRVGLVIIGVLLLATYESMLILGPVLLVMVLIRLRRRDADRGAMHRWTRWSLTIAAVLFAAGTVIGGLNIVFPRDPTNLGGAADVIGILGLDRELVVTVVAGLVFFVLRVLLPRSWRWVASLVVVVPGVLLLLHGSLWAHPWMHYAARTVVCLAMAGMLMLLIIGDWRDRRVAARGSRGGSEDAVRNGLGERLTGAIAVVGPVVLFAGMLVPVVVHTFGFAAWLRDFDILVSQPGGQVALADTSLDPVATSDYGWPWTNAFLSRLMQGDGDVIILSPGVEPADDLVLPGPLPERYDSSALLP